MVYKIPNFKSKFKQGAATKERIMSAALSYSEEFGYSRATREKISGILGIRPSNITYHFGSVDQFQNTILTEAIARSNYIVIAQGIAAGNPISLSANEQLKLKALLKVAKCHYIKQQKN